MSILLEPDAVIVAGIAMVHRMVQANDFINPRAQEFEDCPAYAPPQHPVAGRS
jgi:hypothetical protein